MAQESEIPQSTINSWYRKNSLPSIPSLEKIANALGISPAALLSDEISEIIELIDAQRRLLRAASHLDNNQLEKLIKFLKMI